MTLSDIPIILGLRGAGDRFLSVTVTPTGDWHTVGKEASDDDMQHWAGSIGYAFEYRLREALRQL